MRKIKIHILVSYLLLAIGVGTVINPAYGKNTHANKSHSGVGQKHKELESRASDKVAFNSESRRVVTNYLQSYPNNNKKCPPGLAKKNPLCLPPGQYKKYIIGAPLPEDIVWSPLPSDLLRLLPPPPVNAYYGVVDSDVLLLAAKTRLVLDAISLLSR